MPELGSGGGLGSLGNARKKTFFFIDVFPYPRRFDKKVFFVHVNLLKHFLGGYVKTPKVWRSLFGNPLLGLLPKYKNFKEHD